MGLHLSEVFDGTSPVDTRRAAVLGRPIAHSLSPLLHRSAYAALGLSGWTYSAIDCGAEDLPERVRASGPAWAGYSVTMPAKRAALECADQATELATQVGAANTLLQGRDGSWTADNTDVHGIVAALTAVADAGTRTDPIGDVPAVLLGAGGTAQAAVVALARLGVTQLDVLVRDRRRTDEVVAAATRAGVAVTVEQFDATAAGVILAGAGLIVSTLPAHAADFLAGPPAEPRWRPELILLDALYQPWPTALATSVSAADGQVVGGAQLLLHQAAEQVRLMTGRTDPAAVPLAAMRSALDAALVATRT